MEDPYTWTFDHKDHKHFLAFKREGSVGYVHVQLWPEDRAAVRIIVIDEEQRKAGHGKALMDFLEHWLKEKSYKSLHTESSPAALKFYEKLGYISMPFNDPDGYKAGVDDVPMGK
ncbi:UPF0039 protein YybD, partial [Stylophora pistillata]